MPKLKTETITVRNAAGETETIHAEISVTAHGLFRARVPEHLAGDLGFQTCMRAARAANPDVRIESALKHTYLESSTLNPVVNALKFALERFIDVVTVTERVILYAFKQQTSYAIGSDGKVAQNGYLAGEGYEWPNDKKSHTIMSDDATSYMVAMWARAYDKVTHRRGDSVVVKYLDVGERHAGDYESAANRLNAFKTNATIPDVGKVHFRNIGNCARDDYTEIPYTDAAAEYFTRMLLSMCELARRMDDFFADPAQVQLAIARGAPPLLSGDN